MSALSYLLNELHILDKRVNLNWPRQQKVVIGESLSLPIFEMPNLISWSWHYPLDITLPCIDGMQK